MATAAQPELRDPQALYRQWEGSQWNPFAIDLESDSADWAALSSDDRALVYWALASLLVAEERITTKFSGLVLAYDSEEEESFLTTQQVDEARHMQFYKRFQDEVVAEPRVLADHIERARGELGESFALIFDQALVEAHEKLAASPRDAGTKVAFVTTYHMVIEGTLGLTAFNFITRYLRDQELLGGFVEGYSLIHKDEQRHLAYGTWYLREAVRADEALGDVVRSTLRELLPAVAEALAPPGQAEDAVETLGATQDEIRAFALDGLARRMKIVGVPLETL